MPKQKTIKFYEKEGRPYKTDWDLVVGAQKGDDASFYELWDKYFLMRQKKMHQFIRWCQDHKIPWSRYQDYVETWEADAWEKFKNQMDGIRMNELEAKGYGPDNWGIAIRLDGYFSVVNRTYSNNLMKRLIHEVEIKDKSSDKNSAQQSSSSTNLDIALSNRDDPTVQSDGIKDIAKQVFAQAFDKMLIDLGPRQELIRMKGQNVSVTEICNKLGMTRKEVADTIKHAKERLTYWIDDVSRQQGVGMSYDDVLESVS